MQTFLGKLSTIFAILIATTLVTLFISMTHISYEEPSIFDIESVAKTVVQIGVARDGGAGVVVVGGGVIVSSDGYILTAKHNLTRTSHLFVRTASGDVFRVAYYIADAHRDLAILKASTGERSLPVARIGSSRALRVGQTVFTIGHPSSSHIFDAAPSVSRGIVSAVNRIIVAPEASYTEVEETELASWRVEYADVSLSSSSAQTPLSLLIQTDAMVNSGSSGGPLVDEYGRVVGIIQAIISRSGTNAGMNFAIPISEAEMLLQSIEVEEVDNE